MKTNRIKWISLPLFIIMILAAMTVTAGAQTSAQEVSDWEGFKQAMTADGDAAVILTGDVRQEEKIEVKGNKSLDLNGHTYDSSDRQRGFVVLGTLTVNDSSTDGTGRFVGGWEKGIVVPAGAKLNIHGGTFSTGSSSGYALLLIEPGGKCSMDGGVLTGNRYAAVLKEGENGGGVLELSGDARIIKNGVGVYIENNLLMLADGNHYYYSSLVLKDGAVTIDQNGQNVYADGRIFPGHPKECRPIQIQGDITGSRIGFQGDRRPIAITNGYSEHSSAPAGTWFFTDVAEQAITMEDGEVFLKNKADARAQAEIGTWSELAEAIGSAGETGTRTSIRLTKDIAPGAHDAQIAIGKGLDIEIDLKGHTIDRGLTAADDDGHIFVNEGALSLTSSVGTGELTGGYAREGGAIYNGGILSLNSVKIAGNKAEKAGGAIYNTAKGTLSLLNCEVRGNTAGTEEAEGLGADIYNEGTLRMGDSRTGAGTSIKAGEIFLADETAIQLMGALNVPERESDKIGISPGIVEKQTDPETDLISIPFTMNYSLHNQQTYPDDCFCIAKEDLAENYRIAWDDARKEVVLQDNFNGRIIITYDPNGGAGEAYTVKDDDVFYGKAYITLNANTFAPPAEDMEFAGWMVGGELYQPGELVCFDRDAVVKASWKKKLALSIVATSPDGAVEVGTEPITINNITSGTTYQDLLDEKLTAQVKEHFAKDGYVLARFSPLPLEAYESWADMPWDTADSDFMKTEITDDTVLYAVMAKELGEASLCIEQPACGSEVVKNAARNPSTAENAPEVSLPEGVLYGLQDPATAIYNKYWTTGRAGNPFYGTIQGEPMRAHIRLIPKAGYVFVAEPELSIEGGSYIDEGHSPWDGRNYILALDVSVPIKHARIEEVAAKDVTCTEDGNKPQWICKGCGTHFKDAEGTEAFADGEWVIPAQGHIEGEPVRENETKAGCTTAGSYDLVSRCTVCKAVISSETVQIPALGHMWSGKPPEYEDTYTLMCTRCHEQMEVSVTDEGHVHGLEMKQIPEQAPTCKEAGVRAHWECSCGLFFEDDLAKVELDPHDLQIPVKEHTPSEPVTEVPHKGSCTAGGTVLELVKCAECGDVISSRSTFVPAGKGWDSGHTWNEGKVVKEATTTAEGEKLLTCKVCGREKTEVIPKLAKKAQTLSVKAKTVKIKAKKLRKKNKTIAPRKAMTVSKAQGTVTYTKVKVNKKKFAKKFTINKKTGKITVKKGVKKGTYKMTVRVSAAGNAAYAAGDKTVTVTIKVK